MSGGIAFNLIASGSAVATQGGSPAVSSSLDFGLLLQSAMAPAPSAVTSVAADGVAATGLVMASAGTPGEGLSSIFPTAPDAARQLLMAAYVPQSMALAASSPIEEGASPGGVLEASPAESKKLAMLVDESPVLSDGLPAVASLGTNVLPTVVLPAAPPVDFPQSMPGLNVPEAVQEGRSKDDVRPEPEAGQLPAVGIADMSVVAQWMMPAMATAGAQDLPARSASPEFAASLGDVMSGNTRARAGQNDLRQERLIHSAGGGDASVGMLPDSKDGNPVTGGGEEFASERQEFPVALQSATQANAGTAADSGLLVAGAADRLARQVDPVGTPAVSTPVAAAGWGEELGQQVLWLARDGQQQAELQLNPPNLGPLEVRLSLQNDQASVVFVSAHASVRDALQAALPRLSAMFAESGISMESAMVGDQSLFGRQQPQDRQQHRQGSSRSAAYGVDRLPSMSEVLGAGGASSRGWGVSMFV